MKSNRSLRFVLAGLVSLMLLSASMMCVSAQSKDKDKDNDDDSGGAVALESITEATTIDGQPAMRIQFRKYAPVEIRLEKRDDEDTLVFNVLKIIGVTGKLYVTRSSVTFVPDNVPSKYVKISRSTIKEVEFKDHWRLNGSLSNVNVVYEGDEKTFTLAWPTKGNKQILVAANQFLYRALKNFESAMTEFNKLTAGVRPPSEEAEEEDEVETTAEINDRYDRFKDITFVSTSKMLVRGLKHSIRTYADYSFPGKTQNKPENISLYFYASSTTPLFHEDNLGLNFLIDDKRFPLGTMKLLDEEKTKTLTRQTIVLSLPREKFEQLANAKKAEFQVGSLEYKLTDVQLEAFRKLLLYKIQE